MFSQFTEVSGVLYHTNGNVGIGIVNPEAIFHVYNSSSFNSNDATSGQDHILFTSTDPGNGGYFGGITWKSGTRRRASIVATREHSDADFVGLAFFTQGTDGIGPIYESMRIRHNGNVGIGVADPTSKLVVAGNISSTAKLIFRKLDGSGTAGIGMSGNGENVHLYGTSLIPSSDLAQNLGSSGLRFNNIYSGGLGRFEGRVVIGATDAGTYRLAVEGQIGARSIKVTTAAWADYVFSPTYRLPSLYQTELFIQKNGHLPNVPSSEEIEKNGFVLEEMDAKLMEKIEELTLYMIQQQKQLDDQAEEIRLLKKALEESEKNN
jgi:hypothetical protein